MKKKKKNNQYRIILRTLDYLELSCSAELTTVSDGHIALGLPALASLTFDRFHDIHSVNDFAEHHVLSIQPFGLDGAQEELRPVGVGSSVRHGQDTGTHVLFLEVLIRELLPVDRFTSGSVTPSEISSLTHEVGDDSMEFGSFEMQRNTRFAFSLFAGAETTEVLRSFGHDVIVQLHDNASGRLSAESDIEKHLWATHGSFGEIGA